MTKPDGNLTNLTVPVGRAARAEPGPTELERPALTVSSFELADRDDELERHRPGSRATASAQGAQIQAVQVRRTTIVRALGRSRTAQGV